MAEMENGRPGWRVGALEGEWGAWKENGGPERKIGKPKGEWGAERRTWGQEGDGRPEGIPWSFV